MPNLEAGSTPSISVVVPVYGCMECLDPLCARIKSVVERFAERYEIILVDDRSPDETWATIIRIQERHPEVKGIRLSRNFGQHVAISAGLAAALGDCAVVMDCDLQDPPERIPATPFLTPKNPNDRAVIHTSTRR